MKRLREGYLRCTQTERDGRLPALDGVRALFVLLVGAYHIWQQSWLTPALRLGAWRLSFDPVLRAGYLFVDAMLLLSGFLLYWPHAEAREDGRGAPGVWNFYKKRLLRIVPSYYLCVLAALVFIVLPEGGYNGADGALDGARLAKDLLAHATFTHTLFRFSYTGSPLPGVLWTLGVEMQFYLLFPLLARCFAKRPLPTYAGMLAVAFAYRAWARGLNDTTLFINQLPAQLDVYANGMAAAGVYAALKRRLREDGWSRALFTAVACAAVFAVWTLVCAQARENGYDNIRRGQMARRYALSIALSLFMLGSLLGARPLRLLLGNPLTRVLSAVSFQFYMWHATVALRLKAWGIPKAQSATPWMSGERAWQIPYVALCFLGALLLSALLTYGFEQPVTRLGRKVTRISRNNN